MRPRNFVLVLVAVAAMITVAALSEKKKTGLLLLEWAKRGPKDRPPAAVLIEMGLKDKQPAKWTGRAVVNGAKLVHREGYRFRADDKVSEDKPGDATVHWKTSSHWGLRVPPRNPAVRRMEGIATVGVVLHLSNIQDDAALTVTTDHEGAEKAEVKLQDVLAGHAQELWGGKAQVRLITTATPLTSGTIEDDFPAAAYGPDGTLWVGYISYKVRDESRRIEQSAFKAQPRDFKALYTPEFADQLFVKYFRDGKWSEPIAITGMKEDLVRCALAVEGDGTVRVAYSANRPAHPLPPQGGEGRVRGAIHQGHRIMYRTLRFHRQKAEYRVGPEAALFEEGSQINPVMETGQNGSVYLVCQDDYAGRAPLDKEESVHCGTNFACIEKWKFRFFPTNSQGKSWCPALAAGPDGRVAIARDIYYRGDYDIEVLTSSKVDLEKGPTSFPNTSIAASARFEARPSLCYDAKGRLWIAYEEGPEKWGKDSGALAHGGEPLYSDRSVRVVCLDTDGKLKRPAAELPTSKVGNPGAQLGGDVVHRNETATRYAYPRLGLDGTGRLWLCYRENFGSRYTSHPGSCWRSFARRLDGDHWTEPIEVHHSDGLLDSRPVLLPHAGGGLLIVHNTDGRYTTPNDLQNRIYTSYLDLPGEPVEPKLLPHDPGHKDPKAYDKERQEIQRIRNYRIEAGGKKYQLLRGEFHRHTEISWDGGADGSLEDMFRYAIDAAALDWIGNGDHDNGAGREYSWWLTQKLTDAYHIKDRFTPIFCYERSVSYPHGHRNCLFLQRGVRTLPRLAEPDPKKRVAGIHADDTKMLYRYLKEFDGICAVHTSATGMGTDWRDNDPVVEPLVEIYQGDRNSYEMEDAPRAGHDPKSGNKPVNIAGWFPKGYINHALAKGYRLGFESSSDHWSTHISFCVALAEKHDRAGILAALKRRHCYGATDNILVDVRSGEHVMGDEFKTNKPPVLHVHVIGTAEIRGIDLLRDGEIVEVLRPEKPGEAEVKDDWEDPKPLPGVHYYYLRVRQKDEQLAWSSPLWIDYAK